MVDKLPPNRGQIVLINPNTSDQTTELMVEVARAVLPDFQVTGLTAPYGVGLITDEDMLATAAEAVNSLRGVIEPDIDGVIVAAFGDPGLEQMQQALAVPVVGIAQAGILAAAKGGRRYSIATTTADLVNAIRRRAEDYGTADQLVSIRLTEAPIAATMADPALLVEQLFDAISLAVTEDGAEAVIVGGGPLAAATRSLKARVSVPVIEPVAAAALHLRFLLIGDRKQDDHAI